MRNPDPTRVPGERAKQTKTAKTQKFKNNINSKITSIQQRGKPPKPSMSAPEQNSIEERVFKQKLSMSKTHLAKLN